MSITRKVARSAKTGRFVRMLAAWHNPLTTVIETITYQRRPTTRVRSARKS